MEAHDVVFAEFCAVQGLGDIATAGNVPPGAYRMVDATLPFLRTLTTNFETGLREKFGKHVSLHVGICADEALNAFAAPIGNGAYLIGINSGSFVFLMNNLQMIFEASPDLVALVPTRPDRSFEESYKPRALAIAGVLAGLHFLLAHEVGHIVYGHVDLLNALMEGQQLLVEADRPARMGDIPVDLLQAMEMDADLFAASSVTAGAAAGRLGGGDLLHSLASRTGAVVVATVAALVIFHLFYGTETGIAEYRKRSHPLPELRLTRFLSRLSQILDGEPGRSFADPKALAEACRSLSTLFPQQIREQLYPALRAEGRARLVEEFARIRANEDLYADVMARFAMLPVGAAMY